MEALGFRYITNIAWVKVKENYPKGMLEGDGMTLEELLDDIVRRGIGQYFAGSHELCLFGVRGKTMKPPKALRTASCAPRPKENGKEKHSKKPDKIYEIVEAISPGPYIEFFARSSGRKGWTSWGNEA